MTNEQLKQILPHSIETNRQKYLPFFNQYFKEFGITTPVREAAFIAQIGHESGSLRYVEELASGSTYEGRKDLGNTEKGDGVKFKGRGLIQITGRANYTQLSKAWGVDFVNNPTLLSTPIYAVKSACWWWHNRGLNEVADTGDLRKITKIINGGYNGLADREAIWTRAKQILKV